MSKYSWKDIAWRDFWLIPILVVSIFIFSFLIFNVLYRFTLSNENNLFNLSDVMAASIIASVIAYLVVLVSFYFLHFKTMGHRFREGLKGIWRNKLWIIGAYFISTTVLWLYGEIKTWLPKRFQYDTTQNEMILDQLTTIPWLLPINFLFIVILAPIIEEILFRHLLIGELGKKLNFKVMGFVSIFLFALVHVLGATSPFEIVDYLILAVPIVFLYLRSGCNLGVSIAFHVLNNFVSFLLGFIG